MPFQQEKPPSTVRSGEFSTGPVSEEAVTQRYEKPDEEKAPETLRMGGMGEETAPVTQRSPMSEGAKTNPKGYRPGQDVVEGAN